MSEIVKILRNIIGRLEELRKMGELSAEREEKLDKLTKMLEELKTLRLENTIQSRIAASGRGAMYQLRRAFYAQIASQKLDKIKSVDEWRKVAQKLIDLLNNKGIVDVPTKIILQYDIAGEGDTKYIKFKQARIFYFEPAGYHVIDFDEE